MRIREVAVSLLASVLLLPLTATAASLYVKSVKARLLAAPKFDATLVAEVERGRELALLEKGDRWFKVRAADKDGWVPELLVSEDPPKGNASVLDSGAEDLSGKARRRASAIATAGASRGLSEEGLAELKAGDPKADWQSLAKVEALKIDPAEALGYIASASQKTAEASK